MRLEALTACLSIIGKIDCVRVSFAQGCICAAYPYWGVVRYECRLNRKGLPSLYALGRAQTERRSKDLCIQDCKKIAAQEKRLRVFGVKGPVSEKSAARFLNHIWNDPRVAHIVGVLEMSRL